MIKDNWYMFNIIQRLLNAEWRNRSFYDGCPASYVYELLWYGLSLKTVRTSDLWYTLPTRATDLCAPLTLFNFVSFVYSFIHLYLGVVVIIFISRGRLFICSPSVQRVRKPLICGMMCVAPRAPCRRSAGTVQNWSVPTYTYIIYNVQYNIDKH